jgi:NuA3 HAT complex component NTO1
MTYNAPDTPFHRIAKRIKSQSKEILDQLEPLAVRPGDNNEDNVCDFEPAAYLLEALTSQVSDDVERDRLADLFAFELEKPKEPTPPPPTPPAKKTYKRDTKRKWEEREARHQERLAAGRATRAGQARTDAFKHEAGLPPSSDVEPDHPIASTSKGRRTRKSLAATTTDMVEAEATSNTLQPPARSDRASASSGLSRSRSQVGVVRTEPIERLTDKERRERERHMALITEEVGDSDLFTRFNVGWVLPEGSKRRRGGDKMEASAPPVTKAGEIISFSV